MFSILMLVSLYMFHLPHRGVLSVSGPNVRAFLQGVVTHDIETLPTGHVCYAAHLSPIGRVLFDFFAIAISDTELWLEVNTNAILLLAKTLYTYNIKKEITFHNLSDDWAVAGDISCITSLNADQLSTLAKGMMFQDPRLPTLGHRFIIPLSAAQHLPDGTELYRTHRLALGVPDVAEDYLSEKILPAEMGLEFLNGVSFTKGCFVGQEIVARMHYKTTPKKRIFCVQCPVHELLPPSPCSITTEDGAEAGTLLNIKNGRGLALLSVRHTQKELAVGSTALHATPTLPVYITNNPPPVAEPQEVVALHPSPNHAPRVEPIKYIILHGTWMDDDTAALARLCDPAAEVSCHYFITRSGELLHLVAENCVAWHAGKSSWQGDEMLNKNSIGIEISNPGVDKGVPYTPAQYATLLALVRNISTRHAISPKHVLGHSDIAPGRKDDPGPHFDWNILVKAGVAVRG